MELVDAVGRHGDHRNDAGGEPGASFDAFYRANWRRFTQRAFLILDDRSTAEDVVQDALLAVAGRWDRLDDPAAYAYRSVINGALRAAKRSSRDRAVEASRPSDEREYLDDAIAKLPTKMQAILVLRFFDDLSYEEIAGVLGCRAGSVGPTLNRALKRLSQEVER